MVGGAIFAYFRIERIEFYYPFAGVKVNKVVHNLAKVGIKRIHKELKAVADSKAEYGESPAIDIFIPKFTTESHFTLSPILKNVSFFFVVFIHNTEGQ